MKYEEFLRKVPKVELHLHYEGSIRARSFVELAKKNGVALPTDDPAEIYEFPIYGFFPVYQLVCDSLVDREDFARTTYESLEDGVRHANLRYREMFFELTHHLRGGKSYSTVVDGMIDGIRAAERDYGVRCRLIPCVDRMGPPAAAVEMVREVLANPRDEVIALGMAGAEALGPPERYVEAYELAAKGGLHRTAHACEDGPPQNVATCLDVLGCERIDHGYYVLEDDALVARARDEGIPFNTVIHVASMLWGWRKHPVKQMFERGLKVTVSPDDPTMLHTDLGREYLSVGMVFNFGPKEIRQICLNGIEAAFLGDEERRRMRREFETEIDALAASLEDLPPEALAYFREGKG
jgi:adenosine deaminase